MPTLHALPAFSDNYIWALADDAGDAIVVDPGDAAPVMAAAQRGLRPRAILITHHHADHIGGIARLREHFRIPCYGPADPRISGLDLRVAGGDRIALATPAFAFQVLDVPGHTLSHIAFLGHGHLFCGDTLFSLGCGRLFEGSPAQMLASLDTLSALPDDTLVCCAHEYTQTNARFALAVDPGNAALQARTEQVRSLRDAGLPTLPTTLGEEKRANPFLRVDAQGVIEGVRRHAGRSPGSREEAFAILRSWKDGFA